MPRWMTIVDRCSERCDKQIDKPQHITDRHLHITPSQFMPPKMFINDADTPGFQDRQADFVMLIHFAKCKRGDQSPIPSCGGTSVSTKRMLIDAFQTSLEAHVTVVFFGSAYRNYRSGFSLIDSFHWKCWQHAHFHTARVLSSTQWERQQLIWGLQQSRFRDNGGHFCMPEKNDLKIFAIWKK